MTRKSKIILTVIPAVYILDRLTKLWVLSHFGSDGQSVPVIGGFFNITYVRNTGAAFGFLSFLDDTYRLPFFITTTLVALVLLLYFVKRTGQGDTLTLAALSMIIGGAAGNLTDRLIYGYVIDFIDWYAGRFHWPAFNIADSGITVGIALLGIELFFGGDKSRAA